MFGQLERYIPVFQSYLASDKKEQFISSLKDPAQKIFLEVLTSSIDNLEAFKKKLQKLGINYNIQESLITYKLSEFIKTSSQLKDDQIGREIKKRFQVQNFDHSRPPIINSQVIQEDQGQNLNEVKIQENLQEYLGKKLADKADNIRQFSDYAISKLKEDQLMSLPLVQKELLLERCGIIFHFDEKFISKWLLAFQNEKRKTNESFRLNNKILSCLTKSQLIELGNSSPAFFNNEDYIELWFNQLFSQRISKAIEGSEYFSTIQQLQKRDKFNAIIKQIQSKSQHLIIKSYLSKLNTEILVLDGYVNDPNIDRLINFLSTSHSVLKISNLKKQYSMEIRESYKKINIKEAKMRFELQVDRLSPEKIAEDYLESLFTIGNNNEENIKRLTRFFEQKYLRKLNAKIRLFKGQTIENENDYFTQSQLQSLREKREIKLLRTNNRKFKVQDDVSLQVHVKNVKNIDIKIYQLNLEKHLLNNSNNIDDEINLSFLLPTHQLALPLTYTTPFELKKTSIELKDYIPKAMGVYIVDLQGETVTSRAIIRKGKIICIDDLTEAGQKFSFYDQNGKPLTKQSGLKIWIKKRQIQLESNYILLKYEDSSRYETIVASVGSYAQSYLKQFEAEEYQFDIGYIYNAESFIVGKKAKILLHPRLKMNKNTMSVQLLKNTTVKVNVTNNQQIKTFYSFSIPSWSNFTDQVIEFPIQSYVQNINIVVETQILLQNGKTKNLRQGRDITIDLGQNNQNFLEFYLEKNSKNQYILNLLGLNGQKITNTEVNISYNINGFDEVERKIMKFNQNGQINLGELKIIKKLYANINTSGISLQKSWTIDETQSNFNYTSTIYHKIGQELTLPVNPSWTAKDIILLRTFDKYFANDESKTVKIDNGILKLNINSQGSYVLKFLPIDKNIEILTLKNIKWEGDNEENQKVYDEDAGKVYEIKKNNFQAIHIRDAQFKKAQNHTKASIKVDLSGLGQQKRKSVRVHVFANNYHNPEYNNVFSSSNFSVQSKFKEHNIEIKRSAYYSNKTLSQQGSYVWNRQKVGDKLIGNNLQKPSMFLKRIFVRQTQQTEEQLGAEDQYQEECAFVQMDANTRKRLQAQKMALKCMPPGAPGNINSHNNFLSLTGQIKTNLKGEQSIQVEIPQGYNSIEVLVLTPESSIKRTFALGSDLERQTINLVHSGLQETKQNKGWTMSRQIYRIRSGQSQQVSRNSQWRAVSLVEVFDFANTKKIKLYDWSNHLLNWHTYSFDKKKQIYDKECCHELNTFIKFKDPSFFKEVVANFIRNKIAKTIVDLCLLEDRSVVSYMKINQFNELNPFEKVLLVHSLSKQGTEEYKNASRNIVEALELEQKSIKRNYQIFKNHFDTIINAKEPEAQKHMKQYSNARMEPMMMMKGSAPRMMSMAMAPIGGAFEMQGMDRRYKQAQKKKAFVPVESTKEYTQRTYYNVKNYKSQAPTLISSSPFWSELARYILEGQSGDFLSESFMYLSKPIDFILSACFISSESSANFQLSNAGQNYKITTKVPIMIYVKQVKELQYAKKYAVLINQRFFDPNNRVSYEQDGTQIQKQAEEFISKKAYVCQTVVNNTSGTPLELQVLLDIPKGTIPLSSHQYTKIVNISISPYTSQQFERYFYAPKEGAYPIYPSNASKGSVIIAKASKLPKILVQKIFKSNKLESFGDFLRSGNKESIVQFIKEKNIFDSNIFTVYQILWMLKDKDFYSKVINVLRQRNFYNFDIWNFGFFHGDMEAVRQIINFKSKGNLQVAVFEYFPYYSSRTHQFANENKSTIRNVQFKENYIKFLLHSVISIREKPAFYASYAYYLILQDRLKEAQQILGLLNGEEYKAHQIQFDYMKCFLDLSLNAPNFSDAREIIKKYKNYPLQSWAKLFQEVRKTIEAEDEQIFDVNQKNAIQQFETQIIQQIGQFKVIKPAQTRIVVQLFQLNLELYFSEYPFYDLKAFTSIKPSRVTVLNASDKTQEVIIKRSDYNKLRDVSVEITAYKAGVQPKKISSFSWNNPDIKVKVNQNLGSLQVFINRKRAAGSYIKVFTDKNSKKQFYRDGYTDMTGTFRYAMSDLQGIAQFSILISTEVGGVIQKVKPPSKLASY